MSLRHHLLPLLGDVQLGQIDRARVEHYTAARLDAGARPGTVGLEIRTLRHLIGQAAEDREAPPWLRLPAPAIQRTERRVLSVEEVASLLAGTAPDPEVHLFARLALATGLRAGELAGLRWRDVDWTRLALRAQATKTGRTLLLPIPGPLAEVLMTDRYSHTNPEGLRAAVEALPWAGWAADGQQADPKRQ